MVDSIIDPVTPSYYLKINADGSINVVGSITTNSNVTVTSPVQTSSGVTAVLNFLVDPDTGNLVTYSGATTVYPYGRASTSDQTTAAIVDTTVTTIVTANATHQNDLVGLIFSNAGTATTVTIKDDTTTRATFYLPANDTRGIVFGTPLKQAAVNKAWTATCTGTPSVIVTSQFVVN